MKRLLAVLLVITMITGILSGCGAKKDGEVAETDKTEIAETGEKQIITMMDNGSSSEAKNMELMQGVIDRFNTQNEYNVEIQIEWYENDQYKTKLPTLMTQNNEPDIFFAWAAGWLQPYVENEKVYAIGDALDSDSEWKERFYGGVLEPTTYDGKVYALPSTQNVCTVYYSKDLFAKYNLEIPTTWEGYIKVAKTFIDNGIAPMAMGGQDSWIVGYNMLMFQNLVAGYELYEDIVAGNTNWEDERFIEIGKTFQELNDMGMFNKGYLGTDYNGARELFVNGTTAMYTMGTWDTGAVLDGFSGDSERVGAFFLPGKVTPNNNVTVGQVDKIFAVSEKCENKEAACAFLKMLSEPDVQAQFVEEVGTLPIAEAFYNEENVDPLTLEILKQLPKLTTTLPMNIQFGATIGEEYNNIAVSIAGGNDVAEQFAALQQYHDNEK